MLQFPWIFHVPPPGYVLRRVPGHCADDREVAPPVRGEVMVEGALAVGTLSALDRAGL